MGRPSKILLGLLCAYTALALGLAISGTVYIQQDAAYYCEVAERFADGEGLTSLSDRRGPAEPRAFPQPFEAKTHWPVLLGALTWVTGDARATGTVLSLASLLGCLVLGSWFLTRQLGVAGLPAVMVMAAAVLHRESLRGAVLPLTDSLSLFLNLATAAALVSRRLGWSVGLAILAIVVRHQNVALLLPLLWVFAPRAGARPGLVLGAVAVTLVLGGGKLWEGLVVFLNPAERDSLWRGIRYLGVPLLIGVFAWRGEPRLRPLWLLGLGHLLVLLCSPDSSGSRPWLFALRHGLPFHLTAAAVAGVTLTRSRGWIYWLTLLAITVAFVENVRRPYRVMETRGESSSRTDMVMAESYLREHPLGEDAIVLSQDADLLAYTLGIRSVHLRGFVPEPCDSFFPQLPARSITHVLLAWEETPAAQRGIRRLQAFAECLAPHTEVVAEQQDIGHRSQFVLLRLSPR